MSLPMPLRQNLADGVDSKSALTENGINIILPQGKLWLQVFSEQTIRVVYAPDDRIFSRRSLVVLQPETQASFQVEETSGEIILTTGALQVRVDRASGTVGFYNAAGNLLLFENGRNLTPVAVADEAACSVTQHFQLAADEALYGLGSNVDTPYMNCRGKDIKLVQANRIDVIPFLVSTRNWGILWDNYSKTMFHDGADGMSLASAVADGIDYYFIAGSSIDNVIAGYRRLTGPAPMLPRWAFGYWQSKERYQSQSELEEVAEEFRRRHIPIDVLVQDWQWWPEEPGWWSGFHIDQQRFADLPGLFRKLRLEYHLHSMFSIWPVVGEKSDVYKELETKGMLFFCGPGEFWGGGKVYDAYDPAARAVYWKYAEAALFRAGLDAWWLDGSEPELSGVSALTQDDFEKVYTQQKTCYLDTIARYLNPYSLVHTQGIYEGQRGVTSEKRVVILTRSAFAGQQRHAAITWTGDTTASMQMLAAHISAGVNFSMAGIPYWSHDIGAFFPGDYQGPDNPAYRELYVRWYQFGAFSPIFRSHGAYVPREPWRFGEPGDRAYDTLMKYNRLRYRLLPYIYSLAWRVTSKGYSLMRGLAMDFPQDTAGHALSTEYLFGPAFLVRPVTAHGAASVPVYLADGTDWYDFWTGERIQGGQTVDRETSIDILPLYIRAGSIVPLGPEMQYTGEKAADPLELRIYTGADGSFNLYDDEGDNYNYEQGAYAIIPITWDEATGNLTIGKRNGSFPGMLETLTFHIVLVDTNHGIGIEPTIPARIVTYAGQEIQLQVKAEA